MHKKLNFTFVLIMSLIFLTALTQCMEEDATCIKQVRSISEAILREALIKKQSLLNTFPQTIFNDRDNFLIISSDIINFLLPFEISKAIKNNGSTEPLIDTFQESLSLINYAVGDIYRQIRTSLSIDKQEYAVLNNVGNALYNSSVFLSSEQISGYFKGRLADSPQTTIRFLVITQQLQDIYHKITVGLKLNPQHQDQAESQLTNFKKVDEIFLSFTLPYPSPKSVPENQPSGTNPEKNSLHFSESGSSSAPKRALMKLKALLSRN